MKNVATFLLLIVVSFQAYSDCEEEIDFETKKLKETVFGGCKLIVPTIRFGVSSEYSGFIGLGVLLPFNQELSNWEGYFREDGIVLMASKYKEGRIYDVGYTKRIGVMAILVSGWEAGFSYRDTEEEMYGTYLSYAIIGATARLRYLNGESGHEISMEVGFEF